MALPFLTFYEKGGVFVKKGLEFDEIGQHQQALDHYSKGLEYLFAGVKYDKVKTRRDGKMSLVKQILERAEVIKRMTLEEKSKTTSSSNVGNRASASSEKKSDDQTDKLRDLLKDTVVTEKPNVQWSDVAGLEDAKKALEEAIVLPQKYPQLFVGKRKAWKAILLYGPPGTGKSYLAKAAASNLGENATFYSVSSSDLISKWQGESEKLVRNLFEMAAESAPSVIFIDEIDALCSRRGMGDNENESSRRVKNELLIQMESSKPGVFVLGATNLPYSLDPALRRRFDKRIYIPLPDEPARLHMLKHNLGKEPTEMNANDLRDLARRSEGYSGSDLSVVVRDALMQPVRQAMRATAFKRTKSSNHLIACDESDHGATKMTLFDIEDPTELAIPDITKRNFLDAFDRIKPSVSMKDVQDTERFTTEFGEGDFGARPIVNSTYSTTKPRVDHFASAGTEQLVQQKQLTRKTRTRS